MGGGGGAGNFYSASLSWAGSQTYSIIVGAGGSRGTNAADGTNGDSSSAFGTSSIGGGGGGSN